MKKKITRFEDLVAWQKARVLVRDIYRISRQRPFCRDFTMCDQIRGSALSIPSNIAEGFERYRRREFCQFLSIAKASCGELRSQLYAAFDVEYIDEPTLNTLLTSAQDVGRKIGALRAKLAASRSPTQDSGPRTQD